jgi:hypothetical protein
MYRKALTICKAIFENKKKFENYGPEEREFSLNKNDLFNYVENAYMDLSGNIKQYLEKKKKAMMEHYALTD